MGSKRCKPERDGYFLSFSFADWTLSPPITGWPSAGTLLVPCVEIDVVKLNKPPCALISFVDSTIEIISVRREFLSRRTDTIIAVDTTTLPVKEALTKREGMGDKIMIMRQRYQKLELRQRPL